MTQERKETFESECPFQSGESEKKTMHKRKYTRIPKEVRKKLLTSIEEGQLTIKAASQKLGINYSSAKNIVQIFREESRVDVIPRTSIRPVVSKIVGKKARVKRFTAKRTHLELDNPLLSSPNCYKVVLALKSSPEIIKEYKSEPHFDFAIYSSLIFNR